MPKFRLILLSLLALCLPIIISAQTPLFSAENPIITPENASQVVQLAMIGRGFPTEIAYSPNGEHIAVSSSVGIWVYDTANLDAEPRYFFDEQQYGWTAKVVFSPDSRFMVAGITAEFREASDGIVRLWDVQTGELINRFPHDRTVWHVAYSPDGQFIATASGSMVQIWHIQTGKVAQTLLGDEGAYITSLTYSPDGQSVLASYLNDDREYGRIIVWEIATGERLVDINHQADHSVYSPDGRYIATGGADFAISIWDAQTGELSQRFSTDSYIHDLDYSPDGQFIAVPINNDENIVIYDVQTGEIIDLMREHDEIVMNVAYSPDGRFLISRSWDKTIKVWDMTERRVIHTITGFNRFINAATFSPDMSQIAYSQDHRVWMSDMLSFTSYQRLDDGNLFVAVDERSYNESLTPLLYSPDGHFFVSQQSDDTITVWDVETGDEVQSLINENRSDGGPDVHNLAFRPNTTILTAIDEGVVKFWDVETGELRHQITDKEVRRFSYSPDGVWLALSSLERDDTTNTYDIAVEVLNADTYIAQDDMKLDDFAYGLILSVTPQGRFFLYGDNSEKEVTTLWDVETESIFLDLTVDGVRTNDINYSPDERLILGNSRNRLVLWNAETGAFIRFLEGHVEEMNVFFSADGRYIVSHSSDGTIRIWGVPVD